MIRRKEDRILDIKHELRGGNGDIPSYGMFSETESFGKCRVCAEMVLEPGVSIGEHPHGPDAELYLVLEGELTVTENGVRYVLHPGDSSFTGGGGCHKAENLSDKTCRFLAVVIN